MFWASERVVVVYVSGTATWMRTWHRRLGRSLKLLDGRSVPETGGRFELTDDSDLEARLRGEVTFLLGGAACEIVQVRDIRRGQRKEDVLRRAKEIRPSNRAPDDARTAIALESNWERVATVCFASAELIGELGQAAARSGLRCVSIRPWIADYVGCISPAAALDGCVVQEPGSLTIVADSGGEPIIEAIPLRREEDVERSISYLASVTSRDKEKLKRVTLRPGQAKASGSERDRLGFLDCVT